MRRYSIVSPVIRTVVIARHSLESWTGVAMEVQSAHETMEYEPNRKEYLHFCEHVRHLVRLIEIPSAQSRT